MSETVLALGDIGATQNRLVIMDMHGRTLGENYGTTDVSNYSGTVENVAEMWTRLADGHEIVAASLAIAGAVGPDGELTQAGDLTPWVGKSPGTDIGMRMGIEVGLMNDVVAIARSQAYINHFNGGDVDGYASTLSSGFGGTRYGSYGELAGDEPGHEFLREGAICPCGEEGHMEAWIAGKGIAKNNDGVNVPEWLKQPENAEQLSLDIAWSVINTLSRHKQESSFVPTEWRWTGGVALNQPFILQDAAEKVRNWMGAGTPAFDTITMGEKAGLHGTFVDARELARES